MDEVLPSEGVHIKWTKFCLHRSAYKVDEVLPSEEFI